jgi:hypothetical protein
MRPREVAVLLVGILIVLAIAIALAAWPLPARGAVDPAAPVADAQPCAHVPDIRPVFAGHRLEPVARTEVRGEAARRLMAAIAGLAGMEPPDATLARLWRFPGGAVGVHAVIRDGSCVTALYSARLWRLVVRRLRGEAGR